jgi:hypothetical protein
MGGCVVATISAPSTAAAASSGDLRERDADLDEQQPAEDQVEQRQENVENDEGADRDDRDAERADPLKIRRGRRLALTPGEIVRLAAKQVVDAGGTKKRRSASALQQIAMSRPGGPAPARRRRFRTKARW